MNEWKRLLADINNIKLNTYTDNSDRRSSSLRSPYLEQLPVSMLFTD